MNLDKIKWDIFLEDLDNWERAYNLLAGKLRERQGLMAVLALKEHIEAGSAHFNSVYGEREKEHFHEALENLAEVYDPEPDLKKLKDKLICIDLNPDSHLYLEYGKCICGFYIGLDGKPIITKLRNGQTGEYEETESLIVMNIGYPDPNTVIKVSFLDLMAIDTFI